MQTRSVEYLPWSSRLRETPSEGQPSEEVPPENQPSENQPTGNQPSENPPAENVPSENQPTEEVPPENQPSENQPSGDQPTENQPSQELPTIGTAPEEAPSEGTPSEEVPAAPEVPAEEAPAEETPTEAVPEEIVEEAPVYIDYSDYIPSLPFINDSEKVKYNVSVPIEGLPSFITQEMIVGALKCQDQTGFPASVTIAQIIQGVGYGKYGPGGEGQDFHTLPISIITFLELRVREPQAVSACQRESRQRQDRPIQLRQGSAYIIHTQNRWKIEHHFCRESMVI